MVKDKDEEGYGVRRQRCVERGARGGRCGKAGAGRQARGGRRGEAGAGRGARGVCGERIGRIDSKEI